MKVKYIIADSGGSSTSWALVGEDNDVVLINTGSLHSKYALSSDHADSELTQQFKDLQVPLYFYGAGCGSESVQKQMQAYLLQFGFSEVHVYPDTLAACRALYGNHPGWVAILGTGSILVQYDGSAIVKRIGGYGSLIGDEGSGFYFGKLLLQHLLKTEVWKPEWISLFQSRESILSRLAGADAPKWIAGLGAETAKIDFRFLHEKNAGLFVELYCLPVSELKQISFIGSYGYEQRAVFLEVFEQKGIELKKQLASPIKDLVSYHQMDRY